MALSKQRWDLVNQKDFKPQKLEVFFVYKNIINAVAHCHINN